MTHHCEKYVVACSTLINQARDRIPCEHPKCQKVALFEDVIERVEKQTAYWVGTFALCEEHHREIESGQLKLKVFDKEKVQFT